MKKILLYIVVALVVVAGVWWLTSRDVSAPDVTASPSVSPSSTGSPSTSVTIVTASPKPVAANITMTSPKNGDSVESPLLVTGKARVFENQFMIQIKDATDKVIYRTSVMTDAKDTGQFGNYKVYVPIPTNATGKIKVEALSYSAKGDGSLEGYASAAVTMKTLDVRTLYAGFITSDDCVTATLFRREIYKTQQVALASLLELLEGPTSDEVAHGAKTFIPGGTRLNSVRIESGTAYADFNYMLDAGVAGSCKVQAIRAQIEATLKQFLGVNNVVISKDGKTQDILQP